MKLFEALILLVVLFCFVFWCFHFVVVLVLLSIELECAAIDHFREKRSKYKISKLELGRWLRG